MRPDRKEKREKAKEKEKPRTKINKATTTGDKRLVITNKGETMMEQIGGETIATIAEKLDTPQTSALITFTGTSAVTPVTTSATSKRTAERAKRLSTEECNKRLITKPG